MLLDLDDDLAHGFQVAGAHKVAALIAGQLERIIFLLDSQQANMPPIADSRAYVAGVSQNIYTAANKVGVLLTSLSTNAAAASTVTVFAQHQTMGPNPIPQFVIQFPAGGGQPVLPYQGFELPRDAILSVQSSQAGTVTLDATINDKTEPSLIGHYML